MQTKAQGYLLGTIAAATYGMNPLFALPLYQNGMDVDSVLFFRYLFAILIIAVMLRARGRSFRIVWRDVPPLALYGVLMALSSLTLFESYRHMAAGIASTLLFVYPLMVAGIMAVCFRERLSPVTLVCMLLALGGIALLYHGDEGATLSLTGTLLVFASALSYAIYIVGMNRSRLHAMPTLRLTFYSLLFGLSVFGVRLLVGADAPASDGGPALGALRLPDVWYLWGNLLALGLFPTAISLVCTTAAIQRIGSTPTAILGALEPVTAIVIGLAVFGETLTPRDVLGILLIIVAVALVVAGSSVSHALMRLRKMFPRLPRHRAPRA